MKITLTNAGKRFNRDWIFRNINYEFLSNQAYAIIGPNGSGKSTLLQIIGGAVGLSEGEIEYSMVDDRWSMVDFSAEAHRNADLPLIPNEDIPGISDSSYSSGGIQPSSVMPHRSSANPAHRPSIIDHRIASENIFQYLSLSGPYLELIEEMTLMEFLQFHHRFKPFLDEVSLEQIIQSVQLIPAAHKQIRYFSSGMKQRTKLAQAIFSKTPILLLDEPCTNLDEDGIAVYIKLIERYSPGRIIIVSSNDRQEYSFCKQIIDIKKYN